MAQTTINISALKDRQLATVLDDLGTSLEGGTYSRAQLKLRGATSGSITITAPAVAGTRTVVLPAGSTDFTATGGTGQYLKQASAGAAITVATVPISEVAGLGTNVATALAVAIGSAGAPALVNGVLGTPSSGTLTSCTGLPVSTGISGLGTGVGTFLATPSSANLASAVTDETGSGSLVFGTSPTLTDPIITMHKASTSVLTKNANTTFALIPGLTVALAAGRTYVIRGHLTITASNASGGIKVAIATPDTLTLTSGTISGLNVNNATVNATTTATALASAFGHATAAVTDVWFEGSVVVNAAGTLEIHAAQNAAHASDMTVGVGSTLSVTRVN